MQLDRGNGYALFNGADVTFSNAGIITIGANIATNSFHGLNNRGTFNNNTGGQIQIDRANNSGLINSAAGTFTNSATITIGANSTGFIGISNLATFINAACARVSMDDRLNNSSSFTNNGLFWVNTATAHLNSGTVTNNGIIEYPQGNPIPGVVNNEIISAPVFGTVCGTPISPALTLGATVDFTIAPNWFLNQNLTGAAGTFDQATNTFTNSGVPIGVPTTVYFSINDAVGGCSRTVSVQITFASPPPTGASPQNFCSGGSATIANLVVVGSNIIWYDMATGGSVLPTSTPLVDGVIYYASQTISGCESPTRRAISALFPPPVPNDLCANAIAIFPGPTFTGSTAGCATDDVVGNCGTNDNINGGVWYKFTTVSDAPVTLSLCNAATNYDTKLYVFSGSCGALVCVAGNDDDCGLSSRVNFTAVAGTEYLVLVAGFSSSEGNFGLTMVGGVVCATPPPTGASPQTFCANSFPTVAQLAATGTAIKWYAAASGGSPLPITAFLVNGNHYFASQTIDGCESTGRLDVLVQINPTPPYVDASWTQPFCIGDAPTVASLNPQGPGIVWYDMAMGGSALLSSTPLTNGGHYFVGQSVGGCESPRIHIVATVVTPAPGHVCIGGCSN